MINNDQLIGFFALNLSLIQKQCNGLTHEDSLLQPPFRGNCLNWILGHILVGRDRVLRLLGEEPTLNDKVYARYETDSNPITEDEKHVLSLVDLLELLQTSQDRITAGMQRSSEEDLAKTSTTENSTKTVGDQIFGLYFHETYHTGQTEFLRQLAGKNDKVI